MVNSVFVILFGVVVYTLVLAYTVYELSTHEKQIELVMGVITPVYERTEKLKELENHFMQLESERIEKLDILINEYNRVLQRIDGIEDKLNKLSPNPPEGSDN